MSPSAPAGVAAARTAGGDSALDALDGVAGLPRAGEDPARAPEPARGRLRRFWFVPAGVALLGAAALVPSVGGSGPGAGEARVLVEGAAVVTEADGDTTTVRDDRVDVGPGDRVAVTEGRATFEMAGDVRLEGLGRHDGREGTTVEMAIAPRLVTGRLLAVAPSPIEVEAGDTTVSIDPSGSTDGAAHLDRRLGLGVGTYQGAVSIETAGRQAEVARYRRVEVAAPGALGREGLPLRYEDDDAWDRRFLGEALVIDGQIAPLLAALGEDRADVFLEPATLRRAVPGVPGGSAVAERLARLDDGGTALVLAAIATAVDDRSFTAAWDRADAFQDDGARWGLAALDQGARSADVLPVLRDALDTLDLRAPTASADEADEAETAGDEPDPAATDPATAEPGTEAGAAEQAAGSGAAAPPADAPAGTTAPVSPTTPGGGTAPPTPGGPTPPAPTVPAVPPPPPPPSPVPSVPGVVGDVGGVVGETVDGVTDGVDAVVPGAGQVVDDVVGGLGDLIGGLGGTVTDLGTTTGPVLGPVVGGLGTTVGALGTGLGTSARTPPAG